jgi:hypothetical protein
MQREKIASTPCQGSVPQYHGTPFCEVGQGFVFERMHLELPNLEICHIFGASMFQPSVLLKPEQMS